jgi:hypothetical protein
MTFSDIVSRTLARLNLSSTTAETRVGEAVNEVYRAVTSSLSVDTSKNDVAEYTVNSTVTAYSTLPEITFESMEKIIQIDYLPSATARPEPLEQVSLDSILELKVDDAKPKRWAVRAISANTVTIRLDAYPVAENFILRIHSLITLAELSGGDEPLIPESFHDVLIHGALAIEYTKMEKVALAQMSQRNYEMRLSDLRMFIMKSAYMDNIQGKNSLQRYPWMRNRPFYGTA